MGDLISRKALLERIDDRTKSAYPNEFYGLMLAHDYIEETPAANQWIPVTERLPERGQEVIVYTGGIPFSVVMAYHFWSKDYDTWAHITHWMPLPEAPVEEPK